MQVTVPIFILIFIAIILLPTIARTREAALMRAAMSAQALAIPIPDSMKDAQRARIFKAMLTSIARQNRTMP